MEQILHILLLLAFLNKHNVEAQPTYLYHICDNSSNYTSNSTYKNNLFTILSSLLSTESLNTTTRTSLSSTKSLNNRATGFAHVTIRQATLDPANALYLCRGDVSVDVCNDCVNTASHEIIQKCPVQRVSIIWYDECMLRYSSSFILGTAQADGGVTMYNTMNVTDPDLFRQLAEKTLSEVTSSAARSETGKKFALRKANFTSLRTLYALAQCTPDLEASDCDRCLMQVAAQLPLDKQGSRFLAPSCNVRVELYPFYNESSVPVPPPAVLPPPSSPPPSRSPPPPVPASTRRKISTAVIIAIVVASAIGAVHILVRSYLFIGRKAPTEQSVVRLHENEHMSSAESLRFDLSTIKAATNNFAPENELGKGGFGVVYKGTLSNGQIIAVKRLSCSSKQGANEFENEVTVVAKLQHRNLVRLFGFCLEGKEKLLVYEFVPNKSLDYFLFGQTQLSIDKGKDPEKQTLLDWSIRYKILTNIAKGILYLHEDSRLRIIHRDLKASNVLLDDEMNPKISDFGMAKIFRMNQIEGNTNRVVGTYGYMAPEYAMHGHFSVKTDVYSFGILLLEIISGKRNNHLCQSDHIEILPSFVWKHWRNGTPLKVVDPLLEDSFEMSEVIRSIHIGLLCVQENPTDRPTMAAVIHMLNSETLSMPVPREPAFFSYSRTKDKGMIYSKPSSSSKLTPLSVNSVSLTELFPR